MLYLILANVFVWSIWEFVYQTYKLWIPCCLSIKNVIYSDVSRQLPRTFNFTRLSKILI